MTQRPNERKRSFRPMPRICLVLCLTLYLLALGIWYFCVHRARLAEMQSHSLDGFAMGSYVDQTVWGAQGQRAAEEAAGALADLENRISWRREGDVAEINRQAGGEAVPVSGETGELLAEILEICQKSGGALDVTLGPVTRLWNFDEDPHIPDWDELDAALALVDYTKLSVDGGTARLAEEGMSIDLGAVGKGAACDTALSCYREAGAAAAVVAVGGSVGLYGEKPDGKPFRVSVRDPSGEGGSLGVLELPGGFVSTSGSYEKCFVEDGKTYCHLLDSRTGYPADSGLVSVTVWHPESGLASDGLATACFVLGLDKGRALLEETGGEGLFVDAENNVYLTGGLQERFALSHTGYRLADWT